MEKVLSEDSTKGFDGISSPYPFFVCCYNNCAGFKPWLALPWGACLKGVHMDPEDSLTLLWINTNECFTSYAPVYFLCREQYFDKLKPPKSHSYFVYLIMYHAYKIPRKVYNKLWDCWDYCHILLNLKAIQK